MIAEVVSIGSELTSGQSLDTNCQWLSRRLEEAGIPVGFHTTVADDLEANIDVFQHALRRSELVVSTGGLGPTADDLTRDALARVAGVELVLDPDSLAFIQMLFESRGRQMPERNRVQAMFPSGATVIPNPRGTAPGIWLEVAGRLVVALPGVPREMFGMFEEWVLPRLAERFGGGRAIVHRVLRCFGAGESQIEEKLGDLTRRGRHPEVGITASNATISLRVTAKAATPEEARRLIEPDVARIRQTLGELVFGEGDEELQHAVAKALADTRKTLATAESCTGGLVGHLLTEVPGISAHYLGGVVCYSNEAKMRFLGVPEELLLRHGAVSPEVAQAMARGCRNRFGADVAVAVTGIAGPGGGTEDKPVGLVYVCLEHAGGQKLVRFHWGLDRTFTKIGSAKTALNLVRLHLVHGLF